MRKIIEFFLRNSKFTMILTFIIVLYGVNGTRNILREDAPTVDMGVTKITTIYPGATAEEVETEITKKIEDKIREVKGLKKIESRSQINMSIIKITIDIDNFNEEEVNEDIRTELEKVTGLPATASKPELFEINTEEFSVIEVAIVGDNKNRERDDYVDYLEDEIKDIKGIIKIDKYGYGNREFSVKLDVNKMKKLNVGVDEVTSALQIRNITIPAGSLKSYENQAFVRIDAKTKNIKDLENVLIRTNFEGKKIYLKDIATVIDGTEEKEAYTKINGKEATLLAIKKQGGIDTIKLSKKVKAKIDEVQEKMNSKFEAVYFVNAAEDVENKFNIVVSNVISGVIIILVFLLAFLPGKTGIMTTMSMPITVLWTFGIMNSLGMSLNSITMLGLIIALGMLIDNSIIIGENFMHFIDKGMSIKDAAIEASTRFAVPIITTSATTICAFFPMLLTKGVMGLFISGIPIVVILASLLCLIESFILLPCRLNMIGASVVKRSIKMKKTNKKDWFEPIQEKFSSLCYITAKHRYITLFGFIFILFLSIVMLKKNQFILFPPENVEQYTVKFETNIGDSLEKTMEASDMLTKDIENVIGKENIDNIVAYIGQSGTALTEDLQQNHHTGELQIYINKEASYNLDYKKVLEDVRNIKKPYLAKFEIIQEGAGPAVGRAIEVNIRSNNEENLYKVVNYIYDKMSKVPGIIDLETNDYKNDDEIFIRLDYDKIGRLNLNITDIGNDIKTTIEGTRVANLVMGDDDFYIKVNFDNNFQQTQKDLENISIRDKNGNLIPLTQIAKIERVAGSTMKNRYNFKKTITIRANVNEKIITGLEGNAKVKEFFEEISPKYPDVGMVFGGEQENAEESFSSLAISMGFALIIVFGLLVLVFNSYSMPLTIFTTIPLGLIGFSTAFYLHGRPLSFLAFIGVIGLIGVVVDTGVILVSYINMLRKQNKDRDLEEIVAVASGDRLREVLANATTTFAGLAPTAYGIGGRDASLVPVTLSMAWGLASSTLLSLIWIPCMYVIIDDIIMFLRRVKIVVKRKKSSKKLY